uniref:Uncharacterized protein n=1 Tax=Romanomermis culicivorax TaxID=13658 RepID=A0A915L3W8_ROMCU
MFKSDVISSDVKRIKKQEQQQISLVAEKNNDVDENKSHKEEREDAQISPEDEREQSEGVEAMVTQSKAQVLEKGQKENHETNKSVIPKLQIPFKRNFKNISEEQTGPTMKWID